MIPQIHAEQAPASASFTQACVTERRTAPQPSVGTLSDEEREDAIVRAGKLMEKRDDLLEHIRKVHAIRALAEQADAHYDRYADTGCLAALGDAHRVEARIESLLAGDATEIWRQIPGFSGYSVSSHGRVRRDTFLHRHPPAPCASHLRLGYPTVALTADDGRYVSIGTHALVMLAFVGPRPDGMHICHDDGDRGNSRLSNLRYDTPTANVHDAIRHGTQVRGERVAMHVLKESEVQEIVRELDADSSYEALGTRYGVSKHTIYQIARGRTWREITGGVDRRKAAVRARANRKAAE